MKQLRRATSGEDQQGVWREFRQPQAVEAQQFVVRGVCMVDLQDTRQAGPLPLDCIAGCGDRQLVARGISMHPTIVQSRSDTSMKRCGVDSTPSAMLIARLVRRDHNLCSGLLRQAEGWLGLIGQGWAHMSRESVFGKAAASVDSPVASLAP